MRKPSTIPQNLFDRRSAGVLLHVGSLPGGRLGNEAFAFVDWLAAAGQTWWQILPVGPPNRLGSPYESISAFAGASSLLERPTARVTNAEIAAFVDREAWASDWLAFAGRDGVADQVRFAREWAALRDHATGRGVRLLGDMPLYVSRTGADVALHPKLFVHDEVAGCPPDYFSDDGQLWGSPLYDWPAMRAEGFAWWTARLRRTLELVDAVRIDHFRGLVAYWSIPAGARTAREGRWRRAPGGDVLEAARRELGQVPLVAEDLGVITPAVERLRVRFGLPGMAVLQFMVDRGPVQHNRLWSQRDRIVYPGTHDNATCRQWLRGVGDETRGHLRRSLEREGIAGPLDAWSMVALAHHAPANVAICAAQDLLGLGAAARMNTPSRRTGNWRWRLQPGQLTGALADRLAELTESTGRGQLSG